MKFTPLLLSLIQSTSNMIHQMKRRMLTMINNSNRFVHRLSGDIIINRTSQWTTTYSSISYSNRIQDGVVRRIQSKHFSSSSSSLLQQPNPRKSLEFRTIIELQQEAVLAYPDNPMLGIYNFFRWSSTYNFNEFVDIIIKYKNNSTYPCWIDHNM